MNKPCKQKYIDNNKCTQKISRPIMTTQTLLNDHGNFRRSLNKKNSFKS